jgi:hypothetical protein
VFTPQHYSERASELESAAKQVSNPRLRAGYLELAGSFRDMANAASLAVSLKTDESVQLAERMIGRAFQRALG